MKHVVTEELHKVHYILREDEELCEESIPFDSTLERQRVLDISEITPSAAKELVRKTTHTILGT